MEWKVLQCENLKPTPHEQHRLDLNHCWSCVRSLFKTLFVFFPHTQPPTHTFFAPLHCDCSCSQGHHVSLLFSRASLGVFVFSWGGVGGSSWSVPDCIISSLAPKQSETSVCVSLKQEDRLCFIINTHPYKPMFLSLSKVMIC